MIYWDNGTVITDTGRILEENMSLTDACIQYDNVRVWI